MEDVPLKHPPVCAFYERRAYVLLFYEIHPALRLVSHIGSHTEAEQVDDGRPVSEGHVWQILPEIVTRLAIVNEIRSLELDAVQGTNGCVAWAWKCPSFT